MLEHECIFLPFGFYIIDVKLKKQQELNQIVEDLRGVSSVLKGYNSPKK